MRNSSSWLVSYFEERDMRKLIAAAALVACCATAQADGPKWTGFYLGLHAGYGWGAWEGSQSYTFF